MYSQNLDILVFDYYAVRTRYLTYPEDHHHRNQQGADQKLETFIKAASVAFNGTATTESTQRIATAGAQFFSALANADTKTAEGDDIAKADAKTAKDEDFDSDDDEECCCKWKGTPWCCSLPPPKRQKTM